MKSIKQLSPLLNSKVTMIFAIAMIMSCAKDVEFSPGHSTVDNISTVLDGGKHSSARSAKAITRSIKNSYVGVDRPDGSGSDFSGNMSHFGHFTGSTYITSFVPNSDGTFTLTSDDELIAANGDKIYTSSEVIVLFTSATGGTYTGGFDIVGGTGRFENATGHMEINNGEFMDGTSRHNAAGHITY